MVNLKYHSNPTKWEDGDATGIASYGVFNIVNGEAFIDEVPLLAYLQQFSGRKTMFEFVFPEEAEYEIDEKILPLVTALQKRGIHTMGSCQGHLEERPGGKFQTRAYVAFYGNRLDWIPAGWTVEQGQHEKVWRLQTVIEAKDEDSLKQVHELIQLAMEFYK